MPFIITLRAELLKIKNTAAIYLAVAAAAFGPLMSLLDMIFDEGISPQNSNTVLQKMFTQKFQMTGFVIFPVFIILVCTLLPQTEYKNNSWKQVMASPQRRFHLFAAKFTTVQLLIFLFLLTYHIMMLAAAIVIHFTKPSLHVLDQPLNGGQIVLTIMNSYVSLLAICALQFWMGLRFRNFIAPVGLGMACWFFWFFYSHVC